MEGAQIEYIIRQKCEGKALWRKIGLILLYPVLFFTLAGVILKFIAPLLHLPFFILLIAFIAMVIFITWRFTSVEYEIIISRSDISLTAIYGKNTRKAMTSVPIGSISEIGIYNDAAYDRVSSMSIQKNYLCISSLSAPTLYYAIFDEGKDKCILYLEMTDSRGIEHLKRTNSNACRSGGIK